MRAKKKQSRNQEWSGKQSNEWVMIMESATVEVPLLLPETLDLSAAESFLSDIKQRLAGTAAICIDASEVRTLTLPCAQIILAAMRVGDRVRVREPSTAFTTALDDLGIDWISHVGHRSAPEKSECERFISTSDGGESKSMSGAESQSTNEQVMTKRILTIDDSKTMRDMLMLTLADAGFDVIQAVDGQDGLDVLRKQKAPVDVIITDINMPRLDGYEVIRQLRRDPNHKSTPILVLTTESDADKKNRAREAGATGWMVKPFDPDRLLATVRKVAP
jgi:two-component system chemotaxis response regulator CheY